MPDRWWNSTAWSSPSTLKKKMCARSSVCPCSIIPLLSRPLWKWCASLEWTSMNLQFMRPRPTKWSKMWRTLKVRSAFYILMILTARCWQSCLQSSGWNFTGFWIAGSMPICGREIHWHPESLLLWMICSPIHVWRLSRETIIPSILQKKSFLLMNISSWSVPMTVQPC